MGFLARGAVFIDISVDVHKFLAKAVNFTMVSKSLSVSEKWGRNGGPLLLSVGSNNKFCTYSALNDPSPLNLIAELNPQQTINFFADFFL